MLFEHFGLALAHGQAIIASNVKRSPPRLEAAVYGDKLSFLMLFCTLILVKNARATMEESLAVAPLGGKAKFLAGELVN